MLRADGGPPACAALGHVRAVPRELSTAYSGTYTVNPCGNKRQSRPPNRSRASGIERTLRRRSVNLRRRSASLSPRHPAGLSSGGGCGWERRFAANRRDLHWVFRIYRPHSPSSLRSRPDTRSRRKSVDAKSRLPVFGRCRIRTCRPFTCRAGPRKAAHDRSDLCPRAADRRAA